MKICLTFSIRHRADPLHLCYGAADGADSALREFAGDIDSIPDGNTVFVVGRRADDCDACIGFLKRDFVSVERDSFDQDVHDGADSPDVEEKAGLQGPHGCCRHAVEAATRIVKSVAVEEA